ncbi:MAG: hypothetical protein WBF54_16770 [Terriglobales bacterium]
MQEPTDPLTPQSTSADEAQTDKSSAIPQGATGELASNVEAQNAPTDNADTTSTPTVDNGSSNEEGPESESVPSTRLFVEITPILELTRKVLSREIVASRWEPNGNKGTQMLDRVITHVPVLPSALGRSLILPTNTRKFGSARDLFDSIVALLRKHVMLPEKECSLLAYWSMATWFPDFLPFIPSVVITGPAAAADMLLRTLAAVCRRPVLLADANPAALSAIPLGELSPTLLMREPQLNRRTAALLNASCQPGYLVHRGKDFQQFYCAKCIYRGEPAKDQLLTHNSIHVHVGRNSLRSLPPLPSEEVIEDFQNRLFFYRFVHHDDVAASKFRVAGFQPETRAMAEVLGAVMVDDLELQNGIMELLKERDEQSRVDRSSGQDGTVLRAVLWHCHQPDQQQVLAREIAATANQIYSEEGESLKISSETVGHVLKNLGLYTRRLGNAGRGLVLDKITQSRAHELGYANEVLPDGAGVPACGYCHKLQVRETQEVV